MAVGQGQASCYDLVTDTKSFFFIKPKKYKSRKDGERIVPATILPSCHLYLLLSITLEI